MELGAFSVSLAVKDIEASKDVREARQLLDSHGVHIETRADPDTTGPAHIVLSNPDRNVIMLDQHV